MPFDDDNESPQFNKKTSLKMNNSGSIFNKEKGPSQQDFQKKVSDMQNKSEEYAEKASQLSANFKKILEDKTLLQNKNVFQLDVEKQVLESLIQLSVEMNEDENEKEAMGATGLIALLLRSILIQRDRINSLEFSLNQLNSKIDNKNSIVDQSSKNE